MVLWGDVTQVILRPRFRFYLMYVERYKACVLGPLWTFGMKEKQVSTFLVDVYSFHMATLMSMKQLSKGVTNKATNRQTHEPTQPMFDHVT